ncbi:MAG: SDR family NAD(P)-dependent oxidoreductase [Planctomycetaceae bacterium]
MAHLKPCETSLCMVSTARPGIVTGDELTADYWWENARNCVCFGKAMEQLAERGCRTFLEISAHPVLAPSMTECLASVTGQTNVLHSLRRHEPELAMILGSLGRLHTIGFPIAWETLFAAPSKFVSLPKYPWQHEYYYRESSEMKRWKSGSGWHPLLGDRQTTSRPTWMAEVTASSPAYLRDHRVQGAVVYPAAAFIEMALAAMAAINGDGVRVLADFTLTQGLVLRESLDVVRLETSFDPAHPTIRFGSRIAGETGEWTPHGSGTVLGKAEAPAPQAISLSDLRDAFGRSVSKKLSYEQLKEVGLEYGPAFQGIERVWFGDGEGLGEICVENHKDWGNYELFPPLFDACFQVALLTRFHATADGDAARGLYLPVSIGRLTWRRKATGRVWCHVQLGRRRKGAFSVDLQLFDETGRVIAEALDARCRSLGQLPNDLKSPAEDYLARYSWRVKPLNGSGPDFEPKDFLPMSDSLARQVRDRLEDRSEELERHKHHQEVTPRLNALLAAMITSTFRELGWRPEVSDVVSESSLAERLGVPKCRRGLLTRLLWFLQERSFLRETTEGWSVAAVLPSESSEVCFHGLLQSYPAYLSELSLLRRLGLKLPALLRGEIGAADVFETAELAPLIEQFRLDAPTNRIWNLTLHDVVSNLAAQLPKGRTLRILEYGFNADRASAHDNPRQASRDTSPVLASPGDGLQTSRSMAADSSSIRTVRVTWTNDLVEQGVELASFDVLLLPEGLPAAGSRASALERLRPLLGNGALVVALEPTRTGNWTDFALELLSPPSAPPPPAESGGARRSTEECCSRLRDAGFEDVTAISEPAVSLDHCLLLARHLAGVPDPICNGRAPAEERPIQSWLILSDESRLCEHLADEIRRGGQTPIVATPGDDFVAVDATGYRLRPGEPDDMRQLMSEVAARHEPCGGVIHCWSPCIACEDSLTSADLENAQRRGCVSVLHLVQAIEAVRWTSVPRLIVVTRGAASIGNTPANSLLAAPLVGLARVVMHEHPHLQTRVIDLDDSPEADEAGMVLAELASEDREDEVAYRSGIRYVHRLQRIPRKQLARLPQALQEIGATTEDCAQLTVRTTGILDSLSFESVPRRSPGPGEVEIRVAAAALNFKDVAKAMGLLSESTLEGTASGWSLGLECSGTVTVVGEGVTRYQVGDDVVGFAAHSLGSHAIADVRLLSRRPPHLNHEEAATLTLVSMTAHYALHHLARVRAGERILIHSAAGGVGLAAIQLAFRDGVEVFATAGSSEKREYLRSIGVPHVMDSRSLAFADAIRELTGGRGVDVVLNSLGGEVISRSLALLAPFGRFVELGKRDIERNEVLGLKPFQDNLSFFAADLDRLCVERPELAELICREVAELISDGTLTPLPYRVFPASRIVEAFRHMANARHVGKVIITMQDVEQLTGLPGRELQLPPAATYLVTGGLSGFGLVTAQWLAERGARHLVLMGRSGASTKEARQAIQDLERRGVNVVVAKADVSDAAQVRQALSKLRASMPPLRGVIHSAMVLDDGVLLQLDADRIDRVLNPKVKGAWNLHELTRNEDLDFFVMYSSVASLIGNPGQANYAAANAFLDELCRYRRSLGLPALTVNWGAIADVGVAARSAVVQDHFERLGINSLPPRTALSLLEQLLQRDIVQTAVSPPSDWSRWARLFPGLSSPRFVDIVQTVSSTEGGTEGIDRIREQLVAARPEERGPILESHLRRGLAAVLGASPEKLDVDRPLIDLGLDSLMMVEILTRIRQDLDVEVPPIKFMEGVNLRELAEYLLEELAGGPAVSDAMTVSH